jgi:hypothetical protein
MYPFFGCGELKLILDSPCTLGPLLASGLFNCETATAGLFDDLGLQRQYSG